MTKKWNNKFALTKSANNEIEERKGKDYTSLYEKDVYYYTFSCF